MFLLPLLACAEDKLPALETAETASPETGSPADTDLGTWEDEAICGPARAALAADLEAAGAPGGAVAIWAGGRVVCAVGVGQRGPEDARSVDALTLFRAGQLTRALSAVALLRRGLDEAAGLDTVVTRILPELHFDLDEDWAGSIRLEDVLQSRTGMVDVDEVAADPSDEALSRYLLDVYPATRWLLVEPGEVWSPSVPGDALAGLLLEYAVGMRYRRTMGELLLDPIGLERAFFLGEEVEGTGDHASSWTTDWTGEGEEPRLADASAYDNGWARPSAYIWLNAEDLGRVLGFLLYGDTSVLEDADRERLWTETVDTELFFDHLRYGYGLYRYRGYALAGEWHAGWLVGTDGAIPGFSAELALSPADGVGVGVLAAGDEVDLDGTLRAALEAAGGLAPVAEYPDLGLDPADWAELEGSYLDPWSYGALVVRLEDGALTVSVPLLDGAGVSYDPLLVPVCRDNFLFTVEGRALALTFLRPAEGEAPDRLRSRLFLAEREESLGAFAPLPSPPPRPRRPDPALAALRRAGALP